MMKCQGNVRQGTRSAKVNSAEKTPPQIRILTVVGSEVELVEQHHLERRRTTTKIFQFVRLPKDDGEKPRSKNAAFLVFWNVLRVAFERNSRVAMLRMLPPLLRPPKGDAPASTRHPNPVTIGETVSDNAEVVPSERARQLQLLLELLP
jgi:hypothetical protein